MKATYYTNLVEGGRSIQGDALIRKSVLNEVVQYHLPNQSMNKIL